MFSLENSETLFYLDEDYFLYALALFRKAKSAGKYRLKLESKMEKKAKGFFNFNLTDSQ